MIASVQSTPSVSSPSTSGFLTTGQTADLLGISIPTVKALIRDGSLRSYVTRGGHHRLESRTVYAYLNGEEECEPSALDEQGRCIAVYVRVSSGQQASDGSLDRQLERLLEEVEKREGVDRKDILVFKDVASAFGSRPGLNALVDSMLEGRISQIYCEYADRLSRVSALTRLIEHLAERNQVEIVALDVEETDETDHGFFVKELLDYLTVVTNRMSAAKSRKVTVKAISEDVARKVWAWRGQGYSVTRCHKMAVKVGLTNERGEVLTYHAVEKILTHPAYAVYGLANKSPKELAEDWLTSSLILTSSKTDRIMSRDLRGAYEGRL